MPPDIRLLWDPRYKTKYGKSPKKTLCEKKKCNCKTGCKTISCGCYKFGSGCSEVCGCATFKLSQPRCNNIFSGLNYFFGNSINCSASPCFAKFLVEQCQNGFQSIDRDGLRNKIMNGGRWANDIYNLSGAILVFAAFHTHLAIRKYLRTKQLLNGRKNGIYWKVSMPGSNPLKTLYWNTPSNIFVCCCRMVAISVISRRSIIPFATTIYTEEIAIGIAGSVKNAINGETGIAKNVKNVSRVISSTMWTWWSNFSIIFFCLILLQVRTV